MVQYWVITPYDSRNYYVFEHAWNFDLENGTIAIGWTDFGDIADMDYDDLWDEVAKWKGYPDDVSERSVSIDASMLWRFQHDIKVGDKIIARRGRKMMLAIGTVTQEAYFDEKKGKERAGPDAIWPYSRFLDVDWEKMPIEFDEIQFGMNTLTGPYEEEDFEDLFEYSKTESPTPSPDAFRLETHLEDFIINNMDRIFDSEFELFIDEENRDGQQYPVYGSTGKRIGRIDILARNTKNNSLLVIELKRDQSPDKTVGQIQRYMAWVRDNLNEDVRGLIICTESDEKLDLALSFVKDLVDVKYYTVSFNLHDGPPS